MKKLMILAAFLLFPLSSYAGICPDTTDKGVCIQIQKLSILVPFNEVDVTYLYDVVGKRSLVGGETPLLSIWNLQGTIGAVTSFDGRGAPYVGGKIHIPNPAPALTFLGSIQPGIFGGYSWNDGAAIAGIKADLPIFQ